MARGKDGLRAARIDLRVRLGVLTVSIIAFCGAAVLIPAAASAAEAVTCPNASILTEQASFLGFGPEAAAAPQCRGYELVTPSYKEGEVDQIVGARSANGERLISNSLGAFSGTEADPDSFGAPYEITRSKEAGWVSTPLAPPASDELIGDIDDGLISPNLERSVWKLGKSGASVFGGEYYLREPSGEFVPIGPELPPNVSAGPPAGTSGEIEKAELVAASSELSHIFFTINASGSSERRYLWPGDETVAPEKPSLYEYSGTDNHDPRLVGVEDDGKLISQCGTHLGGEFSKTYNAVSASGERVFFTPEPGGCEGDNEAGNKVTGTGPEVRELYARLDGTETVDISEPSRVECSTCQTAVREGAEFAGASEDGSQVFFITEQELLHGQTTDNLYEYDFEAPEGDKISLISSGSTEPKVSGVARISQDGSHVYFVAKGVLTGANEEGKEPTEGAENLYVFQQDAAYPAGHLAFVATVLTRAIESSLEEIEEECEYEPSECPNVQRGEEYEALEAGVEETKSLWSTRDKRDAQTTPNGGFFVFATVAELTSEDTSTGAQIFEYDAQEEKLVRVSIGRDGFNDDGNTNVRDARIIEQQFEGGVVTPTETESTSVVSEGGDVVFESADALAPGAEVAAAADATSVYEYQDGELTLISDGRATTRYTEQKRFKGSTLQPTFGGLGIDASGEDVFFASGESLVPLDTNTQWDIYDGRVDGGFAASNPLPSCVGEQCQSGYSGAQGFGVPSSTTYTGGANVTPPPAKSKPKAKAKRHSKSRPSCREKAKKRKNVKKRKKALQQCAASKHKHKAIKKTKGSKAKKGDRR